MSNFMRTTHGQKVFHNDNSLTAGIGGPTLLQDTWLIEKLAHFDRERIPERVVHAKGSGAHGYFEAAASDISKYTKMCIFSNPGKRTPLFLRFSTVGGEKGSADTARDPRGFAVKFYTEEGNYDLVGNNTPVFFIRDSIKFPDFIHTQKRDPVTNMPDPNMVWDFASLVPESVHQFTVLFSSRGTPYSYRFMDGFSSHTFKLVNDQGVAHWCKIHFKTEQGIKNLTREEAAKIAGEDPDHSQRDLFNAIANGQYPAWKMYFQLMPLADAATYRFDPFDVTKVWPHKDYPLKYVGRIVLNRNPANYFAEVEQSAFSPSNLIPGIEPSPDKMLQGRLFSYPDTHRHRLGPNYTQIPINAPLRAPGNVWETNGARDGAMSVNGNGGGAVHYFPNSVTGSAVVDTSNREHPQPVSGVSIRHGKVHPNDDFVQAGNLYRLMTPEERTMLVGNLVASIKGARKDIQLRMVAIFSKCDAEYGRRVAQGLGLSNL